MTSWVRAGTIMLAATIGRGADDKPLFTAQQAAQGKAV